MALSGWVRDTGVRKNRKPRASGGNSDERPM